MTNNDCQPMIVELTDFAKELPTYINTKYLIRFEHFVRTGAILYIAEPDTTRTLIVKETPKEVQRKILSQNDRVWWDTPTQFLANPFAAHTVEPCNNHEKFVNEQSDLENSNDK